MRKTASTCSLSHHNQQQSTGVNTIKESNEVKSSEQQKPSIVSTTKTRIPPIQFKKFYIREKVPLILNSAQSIKE